MHVESLGHAGLYIDTSAGSILCDPWVNPAYFGSWFPFPDNSGLDWESYGQADYLYVSHLHRDHYDPENLRKVVSPDTTVLLPDYGTADLENALREIGFHKFRVMPDSQPVELPGGLRVMIVALLSPSDGPIGDSALAVDDGQARILNQNDAKPGDLASLSAFGDYDVHFLQFSGANWWPAAYDLPEHAKAAFGKAKRANGLARAYRYVKEVDARYTVPFAGPAAFLDDELFALNDVDNSPENPFPDHTAFVEYLREQGHDSALVMVPGSVLEIAGGQARVTHPPGETFEAYRNKAAYLRAYAERVRPRLEAEKASWRAPVGNILSELKAWFEPLLAMADHICAGVGAQVLLDISGGEQSEQIVIDFIDRKVRSWNGEKCRYRFTIERALIERLIADGEIDWVNSLFLSMRFRAARIGPYNEFVYTFFKCLSPHRMEYAERWHSRQQNEVEEIQLGNWLVQRKCPHRQADLSHFATVYGDTLHCAMHGYEFDLRTGKCLTANERPIKARPVDPEQHPAPEQENEVPED